jgi:(heptosyl)LPS beta-1,4-glucosyltransferase
MAKKQIVLSIAIAVYNEEKCIKRCLDSVVDIADEIVVVDGGSTDGTVDIVSRYTDRIIHTDNPVMFHINKQKALDACGGMWILQLDADEVVTKELKEEVLRIAGGGLSNSKLINGYFIPRRNYFWGHFMKKGGQYPDYVVRLVKRGFAKFPCKSVHEQIDISGKIGHLRSPLLHYSYMNRAEYWKKADTYTDHTAKKISDLLRDASILHMLKAGISYCIVKPISTFLMLYIRHKGFMDGLVGFEFSLYSGLHFPISYLKYIRS